MLDWLSAGLLAWLLLIGTAGCPALAQETATETADAEAPAGAVAARPQEGAPVLPQWDPAGIADFELDECRGRKVTKADLLGQPWLAAFVFTRCAGPCPLVSGEMKKLQEATHDIPLRLVTITVDPDRDTPETLKKYADNLGADPDRWWFLTGDKPTIFGLVRKSFKMIVDDDPTAPPGFEVIHSVEIMHVNAEGVVIGRYNAKNDVQMARLRKVVLGQMTPQRAQELNAVVEPLPQAASPRPPVPAWVTRLPGVNAALNLLATICLIGGFVAIKQGNRRAHGAAMISALVTSACFLACYLTYHFALKHYTGASSQPYRGPESLRMLYYFILVPHIMLAPVATGLALSSAWLAWRQKWPQHRRLAKFTFPIWLYVSVTGVIIYVMVYLLPVQAAAASGPV
ncbi:MAG: DUF420 domain-containing protein [Planctomycetaceae bacterium]